MTLEKLKEKRESIIHKIEAKNSLIERKKASIAREKDYLKNTYGISNITRSNISKYREWYAWADISTAFYYSEGCAETIQKLTEEIKSYKKDLEDTEKQIDNFKNIINQSVMLPDVLNELKKNLSSSNEFDIDNEEELLYTIADVYFRVSDIVGYNADWNKVVCVGTSINGTVYGDTSKVIVTSVLAGGYGVQKRHMRTVVKQVEQEEEYEEE